LANFFGKDGIKIKSRLTLFLHNPSMIGAASRSRQRTKKWMPVFRENVATTSEPEADCSSDELLSSWAGEEERHA
jgi:hypothetical protein